LEVLFFYLRPVNLKLFSINLFFFLNFVKGAWGCISLRTNW